MIKSLVAAVALTICLAGSAVPREAPRHHHHYRHHMLQPEPTPDALPPGPSPYALSPSAPWSSSGGDNSIYWSPAGGNPIHYAQTRGFYAGR